MNRASPHSASLSPRQRGWLRWSVSWSAASLLSCAMLAALASSASLRRPVPAPERLAVALQAPALPAPAPTPAPAHKASPTTAQAPAASPASVTTSALTPLAEANLNAAPPASGNAPPAPPAQAASALNNSLALAAALPLRQRCPQQIEPVFPRRALNDDVEQGRVLVRLKLDGEGRVREVEILEASPRGYFEAATREAALQWRCLPSGEAGDSVRAPFVFGLR